jgi:hypothetical protein
MQHRQIQYYIHRDSFQMERCLDCDPYWIYEEVALSLR